MYVNAFNSSKALAFPLVAVKLNLYMQKKSHKYHHHKTFFFTNIILLPGITVLILRGVVCSVVGLGLNGNNYEDHLGHF